jgi:2-polyprenyl-3-methyl-5-hydroxy-6-metoxy-1,4-benzoquinol methylase
MKQSKLRTGMTKLLPLPVRKFLVAIYLSVKRMLVYKNYDSSEYWRKRASCPGQAAVLWNNQEYNELYRINQSEILKPHIAQLHPDAKVLDIGCGIGTVSSLIRRLRADVTVDAVDFEEMIAVCRQQACIDNVNWIASSAEEFTGCGYKYDLIISSGCYSAIRDIDKLKKALTNAANMLANGGRIVMIDPFHRSNYLARAKFGTGDVVKHLQKHNLAIERKSGILFWPWRVWLANSEYKGSQLKRRYDRGEKLLKMLGRHYWADYKILVFKQS